MADRPLLLFPTPETADRTKLPSGRGRIHRPSHGRQGARLSPRFTQLQAAFDTRRVELQQTTAGIDPEQVLVIETLGNVEDFANAVKRIEGLEWMGEIETEEIAPDEDFYDESDKSKKLSGRLYLVMTNQRALNEMLSLWQRYQNAADMKFEWGLTKFRDVFLCLKDIRRWGVKDRIEETGVLDVWREDLEHNGDRPIRFEVELWFRNSQDKRQMAQTQVIELIRQLGGTDLDNCIIRDIAYHALLAEVPANVVQQIIEHPDIELVKCDSVMFFRPVGQMATGREPVEGELSDFVPAEASLPSGDPIVAVLDGLPLANHNLLANRLIIDDPDDYASEYTVADRVHGTAMSSLVAHGDLSDNEAPLARPVYVRPITKPNQNNWRDTREEFIPDDVIIVDHIHRAVRRMFDGDGTSNATVPTIKIINFSIGDPSRQFTQTMSPLARLLDWLSIKYRVLFFISAGNHHRRVIDAGVSKEEFNLLSDEEKEALVVKALYGDARHRKLLAPAESINGITVGSLHHDSATVSYINDATDLFGNTLPSPVSAFGSGYRRAVKPDLIYNGGRVLYRELIGTPGDAKFESLHLRIAPGNRVASPSAAAGDLNKAAFCCGTSNATALVSRMAAICHDSLVEIFDEQAPDIEFSSYVTPLLKAMIVHGCSWGEISARLQEILQTPENVRHIRHWISQWLGYGVPDSSRVLGCTEQRATLLGFGQLRDEEAHVFRLPLPPALGARRDRRRLTVTIAWLSPLAANTQRYRTAYLWFEVEGGTLVPDRQNADWRAVRRGTVQHEIFEGERAVPLTDGDSLTIKVNCRKDAARIQEPVAYGLAASLEVAEGIDIAIYDEIRTRIASAVEIRTGERH